MHGIREFRTIPLVALAATTVLLFADMAYAAESEVMKFKGVVTYHLIPAKVIRVNEIIQDPEPGTSYIGDKSILVEFDGDIDVRANWTVVNVEYNEYNEPRVIEYEVLGDPYEVTVKYHASNIEIDGDISEYIQP